MQRSEGEPRPIFLQLISVRWWNASAYYGVSLAEALRQAGYAVMVGGRKDSPPLRKAAEWGLPTFTDINLESLKPMDLWRNLRTLRRFVASHHIPLINAHRPEDAVFARLVRQKPDSPVPVIRTVSDVRPPKNHVLNRLLHRQLDFFIFSCRASYERYQAVWPIFEGRSEVIYSAIDTEKFAPARSDSPLRRRLGFGDENVIFGIVARLDPVKDHRTFLRAAALTAGEVPAARFLIAGESCNVSMAELQQLARQLGIFDSVAFVERDPRIDVRELIGALDVGIVASNGSEVICRVAVEYMARAKPQIVTAVNVLPEIVTDGENGFVVPAGDADAMAQRMIQLARNPELRGKMGRRARAAAETRFSYPVFAKKTMAVYDAVRRRSTTGDVG